METQYHASIDLPAQAWRCLVHSLFTLLPPPGIDTPEALLQRNYGAIARIAALHPVNAAEAELAAQCIIARAQAEDVLRLAHLHAEDIKLATRLKAQYNAMVKTSLSAHSHLLREQQIRRRCEAIIPNADANEWTRHIAERAMLEAAQNERELAASPLTFEKVLETEPESQVTDNETPPRQPRPLPGKPRYRHAPCHPQRLARPRDTNPSAVANIQSGTDSALRRARLKVDAPEQEAALILRALSAQVESPGR